MEASLTAIPPQFGASLGQALEGHLIHACDGRLAPVRWFRSDWQRGGGSTGWSVFQSADGPVDVVVKIPVGPVELRWSAAISEGRAGVTLPISGPGAMATDPTLPTPSVLAAGESLGGYDLGYLVIERLPGLPLAARLDARGIEDILAALAEWHDRASAVQEVTTADARPLPDWETLLHTSREVIQHAGTRLASAQRWKHIVHDVQKHLPRLLNRWEARPMTTWCHGDLHPGNAMRRAVACNLTVQNGAAPGAVDHLLGPAVLLDLALVHPGHWVEDVLYFERVYWGRTELLRGVNLVSSLARIRRERGHHDSEDYGLIANVRRVLAAAAAPGLVEREGNPKYLAYALDLIPRLLPMAGG